MASPKADDNNTEDFAPLISVVGCDGSGKSTLSADLVEWISQSRPVETSYLGLRSGNIGNKIKSWPIIGKPIEKVLSQKATQARTKESKIPGFFTALVIYIFSRIRKARFEKMLSKRRAGVLIITDRYPQIEAPGFYDGPGLSAARAEGRLVQWLARRELNMYKQMVAYVPDLVIRLNIDVETAYSRKPDHKLASLKAKVAVTPELRFNGAPILDLSSLDPYDEVLASAKRAISEKLSALNQQPTR